MVESDILDQFSTEQDRLLQQMRENAPPHTKWPDGCYGSFLAWLTFVGPSPGGGHINAPEVPRDLEAETPFWDTDYTDPCELWSKGFRVSTQIIVETILGRDRSKGALKIYNYTNFDWIQNPNAVNVPKERMHRGVNIVLSHLREVGPRVVVSMGAKAHKILTDILEKEYKLRKPQFSSVRILCPRGYHRVMDAYEIINNGPLKGTIIVRSPQHPARIFSADYAYRCARAIRKTILCIATNNKPIDILEL